MTRSDELKPWKCDQGHILGQTARNGRGITQLLLYRHPVDPEADEQEVDVMATVEGLVLDVRCEVCGKIRTWAPGAEAMERLIELILRQRGVGRSAQR